MVFTDGHADSFANLHPNCYSYSTPTPLSLISHPSVQVSRSQPLLRTPLQTTPEFEVNEISKDEQMHILSELNQIVKDIYVYPDFNGKDWNGIQSKYQAKIEAGLDKQSFYQEMSAMIEELDEHSFSYRRSKWQNRSGCEVMNLSVGIYGQQILNEGG
jgi:hypothetical protein